MSPPRRRSSFSFSSPLLDLPLLILLLSIIAFLLFFFAAILPFISSSSHNKLKPNNTVKKSWDSLSIFLVLFAILCGIFARRNDDDSASSSFTEDVNNTNRNVSDSNHKQERHSVSNNWFDQFALGTPPTAAVSGAGRLKRSSSSYPDLRQDNLWESGDYIDRLRFFDDFEIIKNRSPATSSSSQYICHWRQRSLFEESNVKEIPVDTYILRSSSLPSPSPPPPTKPMAPPPPPPPPPPPVVRNHKKKRAYKTVARKEKAERAEKEFEFSNIRNPPPPPPPPPPRPPPPPPVTKSTRSERKKNHATKELKMVLTSLYHQSKRKKKQKTRSLHNNETLHSPPQSQFSAVPPPSPTPSPPPPPPPPPQSMFHNLFRKGTKSKRIHSFSAPPPPPPPPPPRPSNNSASKRWSNLRSRISSAAAPPLPPPAPPTPPRAPYRRQSFTATGRPPLPTRASNYYEENVNNGGQSPVIPMPPSPPLPPFRVPGFKFTVEGDYVKIGSAQSPRCSSPEFDEMDTRSTKTVNQTEGGDGNRGSAFCPSPDVNAKADTFIARLRGEWRLEKINSWKEKRSMGLSPEGGPISGPSTL